MKRVLFVAASASLLTACSTHSLQELRDAAPKGTPFQAMLAKRYLAYAEQEEKNYDWADSWHFAEKGLQAAYGTDPEPEAPEARSITEAELNELRQARAALMEALNDGNKETKPQLAADAQYFFDCWTEQQEEEWKTDDIAYCRENFEERMMALNAPAEEAKPLVAPAAPEPEAKPKAETSSYLVFFGWNRPELDAGAERIVAKIAEALQDSEMPVVLNGHTDASGASGYNMRLSLKRADAVKKALIARGIAPRRIQTFGFGETDLRDPTPDGRKSKENRRVEIFVN